VAEITRRRAGELVRGVFEILLSHPDGLPAHEVLSRLEAAVPPTDFEETAYPERPNVRRYEKIVRFSTIGPVKANWLVKKKGLWSLTDEGRRAFAQYPDPEQFALEFDRLYRQWKRQQPPAEESVEEHVGRLYPDPIIRSEVLRFLADAVREADRVAPEKWKITIKGTRVRQRVGKRTTYELKAGRVRVGIPWQALSSENRAFLATEGKQVKELRSRPLAALWELPVEAFRGRQEWLRPMLYEYIRLAASAAREVAGPETHSKETIQYLEEYLGQAVPQPRYTSATWAEGEPRELERAVSINQPRIVFKKVDYDLAGLLNYIDIGDIGLPDIQRPFVWSKAKVRDLFDSMYRGFPVGYLLFWANAEIQSARRIGVGEKQHRIPALLVVDGQQRLTSLFAVLRGRPIVNDEFEEERIEIAFRPRDGRFEVTDAAVRRDPEFIPNISELWASGKSSWGLVNEFLNGLEGRRKVDPADREIMGHNLDRLFDLQKYPFTALEISTGVDEEAVADIFVRINSEGVKLNQADFILTLLSVFWDEGRGTLEAFSRAAKVPPGHKTDTSPFNYLIAPQPDQLLRVAIAVGFHRARMKSVYQVLRGKDIESGRFLPELRDAQFARLREAQEKVLDLKHWHLFLGCLVGAGFRSHELVSSENALLYAYAMYLLGKLQCGVEERRLQRLMARWFVAVTLTGRYTGSPETVMEGDLNRVKDVREADAFVDTVERIIAGLLTRDFWTITLVSGLETSAGRSPAMFAYHAAQNRIGAPVLFSDKRIVDLLDPAIRGPRKPLERHHLFPRRWLERNGVSDRKMINQIANFALLEWPDNARVRDESPSEYVPKLRPQFSAVSWERMCQLHALPERWEELPYEEFLQQRRALMAQIIRRGFEALGADEGAEGQDTISAGTAEERPVWRMIENAERRLRQVVREKYAEKWGSGAEAMVRQVLGGEAVASSERMRERYRTQYARSRDVEAKDLLEFCYLGQLVALMTANQSWELFRRPFRDKRELEDLIRYLTPVRNDVAHFRPVPSKELERCRLAIDDLNVLLERL
jgi:hypothetical protein